MFVGLDVKSLLASRTAKEKGPSVEIRDVLRSSSFHGHSADWIFGFRLLSET
jgi:hypothetical protein